MSLRGGRAERGQTARRKRAIRTCLSCRQRKVRCNLPDGVWPCSRCCMDGFSCNIDENRNQGCACDLVHTPPQVVMASNTNRNSFNKDKPSVRPSRQVPPASPAPPSPIGLLCLESASKSRKAHQNDESDSTQFRNTELDTPGNVAQESADEASSTTGSFVVRDTNRHLSSPRTVTFDELFNQFSQSSGIGNLLPPYHHAGAGSKFKHVRSSNISLLHELPSGSSLKAAHCSSYAFLKPSSLCGLAASEIDFLERQGCFIVPRKPELDVFIKEYFLYVHPMLPIFSEGEFWNLYSNSETNGCDKCQLSLFTFQAMLAATASVSTRTFLFP